MTDQLTTGTPLRTETLDAFETFETATRVSTPAPRPAEAPHWTQHAAREFPHRSGDHAPNLATLAQLRSGGFTASWSMRACARTTHRPRYRVHGSSVRCQEFSMPMKSPGFFRRPRIARREGKQMPFAISP